MELTDIHVQRIAEHLGGINLALQRLVIVEKLSAGLIDQDEAQRQLRSLKLTNTNQVVKFATVTERKE